MLFDKVSGSYNSYDGQGVTDDDASWAIDYFRAWIATISSTEYAITTNTSDTLAFINSLSNTGNYQLDFVTRIFLGTFESDMLDEVKVPTELLEKKFKSTQKHLIQKIKGNFKNLYSIYSTVDPLTLILNLSEVQVAFAYYMIAEVYSDLKNTYEDNAQMKEDDYRGKYKEVIKDSLDLLAIDEDQSGELSNSEKGKSTGRNGILER